MAGARYQFQRCTRCILPSTFPGIAFDAEGVCNLCLDADPIEVQTALRTAARDDFARLCEQLRLQTASAPYDCIVALSGGKDSTYTLIQMVEVYNMRCLAVTIDNGFLSPSVAPNVHAICDGLGVDHVQFRPPFPFMRTMYKGSLDGSLQNRAAIKRASAICNSCINLINTHVVNTAIGHGVPLIAGGYLSGQLPKGRAVIEFDPAMASQARAHQLGRIEAALGTDASKYFSVNVNRLKPGASKVYIANPMAAIEYNAEDIIRRITQYGWVRPQDTGQNSSNCTLNDFGIRQHYDRYQFHPYEAEIAEQVRNGQLTREAALRQIETIPTDEDLAGIREKLEIFSMQAAPTP